MRNQGHTTERWRVAEYDEDTGYTCIETVERGTDLPDRGYEIAQVSGREDSWRCLLIAAAPEMLEALEYIVAWTSDTEKWNPETARDMARAAIAKARGDA